MNVAQTARTTGKWAPDLWLRRFFWTHPEWWSLVLVALAWGTLLSHAGAHQEHIHQMMSAGDNVVISDSMTVPDVMTAHETMPVGNGAVPIQTEFLDWCLMVVAMMVPLVLAPLRWVAFQSFRQRRHRAILHFLVGFLMPWMLAGGVAAVLLTLGSSNSAGLNPLVASGLFALAAIWVLMPARTRALSLCHLTIPLAPSGWHADRDCMRFGLLIGASCTATCGLLMLACAASGHSLLAMIGGIVLGALEFRSFRQPIGYLITGSLLLAGWFLLPVG